MRGFPDIDLRIARLADDQWGIVHRRHLRPEAYRPAAVLACGRFAVLSPATAARHLELRPSHATRIDVSIPYTTPRGHPGIRVHRRARRSAPGP